MKTAADIRWENLLLLIEEAGGDEALSIAYKCDVTYIRQMKGRSKDSKTGKQKGIGERTARKLESVMGKGEGWLDQDRSVDRQDFVEGYAPPAPSSKTWQEAAEELLALLRTAPPLQVKLARTLVDHELDELLVRLSPARGAPPIEDVGTPPKVQSCG